MFGMVWFQRQAFKVKISILVTFASSLVLAIVSGCMIVVEIGVYKKDLLREQQNILDVVGANLSAPLVFDDILAIEETLAVYEKLPDTEAVVLYNQSGKMISSYGELDLRRSIQLASINPINLHVRSSNFESDKLVIQLPILVEDEIIGAIHATTSLDGLRDKVFGFILVACGVFLFALLLAFLLGSMSGRFLSRPIEELAKTMAEVQNTQNYHLKTKDITGYELTKLASSFDEMLNEIRIRDELAEAHKQELEVQKNRAIQASESKSEFLANMSHEIRTPMNGVMGMAQLLMRSNLPSREFGYAEIIYESGEALMTILNDILDFSKIEAGRLELDPVKFDVMKAITNITGLMDSNAREKGIRVMLACDNTVPRYLIGDAGRIRQILLNLIGNAIKFTHEGEVFVKVSAHTSGTSSDLKFIIADSGVGIPSKKLEAIFDKFTQAEGSTTRMFGGTGLGLSISKSLIDAMGGTIDVKSIVGKGSTFTVTVPLPSVSEDNATSLKLKRPTGVQSALIYSNTAELRPDLDKYLQLNNLKPMVLTEIQRFTKALKILSNKGVVLQAIVLDMTTPTENSDEVLNYLKIQGSIPAQQITLIIPNGTSRSKLQQALNNLPTLSILKRKELQHESLVNFTNSQNNISAQSAAKFDQICETASTGDSIAATKMDAKRILVADDNNINLTHISSLLSENGCIVDIVKNGHEAYNAAKKCGYDAILMDLGMPVMNGHDALNAIRAYEAQTNGAAVPVIAVTGHAAEGDKALFLNAGFDGYISKPIDNDLLLKTLTAILGIHERPESVAA